MNVNVCCLSGEVDNIKHLVDILYIHYIVLAGFLKKCLGLKWLKP